MTASNGAHFAQEQAAVPVLQRAAVETLLATSLSRSSEMLAGET
jgi:hypothetical protein